MHAQSMRGLYKAVEESTRAMNEIVRGEREAMREEGTNESRQLRAIQLVQKERGEWGLDEEEWVQIMLLVDESNSFNNVLLGQEDLASRKSYVKAKITQRKERAAQVIQRSL